MRARRGIELVSLDAAGLSRIWDPIIFWTRFGGAEFPCTRTSSARLANLPKSVSFLFEILDGVLLWR